jgi:hypothetical protein
VKRTRHITATDLAECCVCEQRVLFDHVRGKRRTAQRRQQMLAGEAAHAALHREALRDLPSRAGDGRCFVASALWGPTDPRTQALRAWRNRWLLKRWWGPSMVGLYYAISPWLVGLMRRTPRLRASVEAGLSAVVRRLDARRE